MWRKLRVNDLRSLVDDLLEEYDLEDADLDALIEEEQEQKPKKVVKKKSSTKKNDDAFFESLLSYRGGESSSEESDSPHNSDTEKEDSGSEQEESDEYEEPPKRRGKRGANLVVSFEDKEKKPKFKTFTLPRRAPADLSVKKNKEGRFEEPNTGILVDKKTQKVYGVQSLKGKVVKPTEKHLKYCKIVGLEYDERLHRRMKN